MAIKLLDNELITKIAAGEVIERPASIIKELLENSIDAKASKIDIELEQSGLKLLKISDNGIGMSEEDAKMACIRHATSKIANLKDLFEIRTMGFRGEALASVASVSTMTLITKTKDDTSGYLIKHDFGTKLEEKVSASNTGTTIIVEDLFKKIPVRLKFLDNPTKELKYIVDIATKIALINNNISIMIKNNGKVIFHSQNSDHKNTIATVLGTNTAKNLMELKDDVVTGFISKPALTRGDRSNQFIFLNHRPIENKAISDAIYDAYHTLLFLNRHPIVVLNIDMDPTEFDINVHPTKKEVRFEDSKHVYNLVFEAIKKTFESNDLTNDFDAEESQSVLMPKEEVKQETFFEKPKTNFKDRYTGFEQKELSAQEPKEVYQHKEPVEAQSNEVTGAQKSKISSVQEPIIESQPVIEKVVEDDFFVIGQIHKTYIVCETKEGLSVYDQHATEERINYEKIIKKSDDVRQQNLLEPKTIELSAKEMKIVSERIEDIQEIGFGIEIFGSNTIIVRTLPCILGKLIDVEIIYDIINTFETKKNSTLVELKDEMAATMACRASIKAGDILTRTEMTQLIREYKKCDLPYTCPHGRPATINMNIHELEKLFKRLG